jgi:hypothetical protein
MGIYKSRKVPKQYKLVNEFNFISLKLFLKN